GKVQYALGALEDAAQLFAVAAVEADALELLDEMVGVHRDRGERIAELVDHAGGELPERGQLFGLDHLALEGVNARHVLADGDQALADAATAAAHAGEVPRGADLAPAGIDELEVEGCRRAAGEDLGQERQDPRPVDLGDEVAQIAADGPLRIAPREAREG